MEDLIFFIVIALIWGLSQLARMGRQSRERRPPRRAGGPRHAGPASSRTPQTSRDQVTLEEWMERVRTGQAPPGQAPQRRESAASAAPEDPAAILEQWRQRTQQPRQTRREVPVRTPPPTTRPDTDPYATRQAQMQQAQEAERAQRRALEAERKREQQALEQQALEQREAQRRARKHGARERVARRQRRGQPVAVPQTVAVRLDAEEVEQPIRVPRRSSVGAYMRPADRPQHAHTRGLNLSHDGLRQGIVLAEVLGPPVALRPPGSGSPFARVGALA